MIYIGNDIVEVCRIKRISTKYGPHFFDKIFSKKEIEIIRGKNNNPIYLSGKFAAKEASKKALLSSGLIKNIPFKEIQVLNQKTELLILILLILLVKILKFFKFQSHIQMNMLQLLHF